jgi:hypothetical protein
VKNAVVCDLTPCGACENRVSEERIVSIIRLVRIGELGTTLAMYDLRIFTAVTMKDGSSGMLRRVAHIRTDVSEELSTSIIRVTRIGELEITLSAKNRSLRRLLVTANVVRSSPILVTLMTEVLNSSETSIFTRASRRNIP